MCSEIEVNILICCTGSVAAIKLPILLESIIEELKTKCCLKLKVCYTEKAKHFINLEEIGPLADLHCDNDEWSAWNNRGDPVLHIELSKWADMIIIAPLDANTLAKIATVKSAIKGTKFEFVEAVKKIRMKIDPHWKHRGGVYNKGLCDNLVTCIVRAWEVKKKPLLFCPAMNTKMWQHPVTSEQVGVLKRWGHQEVPCISKTLMCGDTGLGAMAEPADIVKAMLPHIADIKRLKGTPV